MESAGRTRHGQGATTALAQIAADASGLDINQIESERKLDLPEDGIGGRIGPTHRDRWHGVTLLGVSDVHLPARPDLATIW